MATPPPPRVPTLNGLGLSVRVIKTLRLHGIKSITALTRRTPSELLALSGLGAGSVRAIRFALIDHGLALLDEPIERQ